MPVPDPKPGPGSDWPSCAPGAQEGSADWIEGNSVCLLENGEQFFPRVLEAIDTARDAILVETFILWEDKVGNSLSAALCAAAQRGVAVTLTVDGFGTAQLSQPFIRNVVDSGVAFRVFDPGRSLFGQRLNLLRRMHRKLIVVDNTVAFVGGINFSSDQMTDYGAMAKQDYAVELAGPVVAHIGAFMRRTAHLPPCLPSRVSGWAGARTGDAAVLFATRDDKERPEDIECLYRAAIRGATRRVIIANAYFFPGYRLFRDLCDAARRGVSVRLVLQGTPDMQSVGFATSLLYNHLLQAGVQVDEYCARPLHGKVGIVDDHWSTVGSSNLDPLSLTLNMEANVFIRSEGFNCELSRHLERLAVHCRRVHPADLPAWGRLTVLSSFLVFHVLRWVSRMGNWLPHVRQRTYRASAGS